VALCEALRWPGRILGASVSREADHCFLSVQVEVPEQDARRRRSCDGITGVDLGVSSVATLSSGEKIAAPRPLRAALYRLRRASRPRRERGGQSARARHRRPCGAHSATRGEPGGKVTPARHEHGRQDGSGQEEIGEHLCAPSR